MIRSLIDPLYEQYLKMQCQRVPNHIAIIQDGNRRYARMLGIDTTRGHRAGADKTEEMLDWAHELGIRHITLYTFSTENFSRKKDEVDDLFALFKEKVNWMQIAGLTLVVLGLVIFYREQLHEIFTGKDSWQSAERIYARCRWRR